MSRFFSKSLQNLEAYTPGEQPKDNKYIKLNTNESPFIPPKKVMKRVLKNANKLNLYPDPECYELREKLSKTLGVDKDEIILGNGSDEVLNFIFKAFCDNTIDAAFADITYGFYEVFANLYNINYQKIPLKNDFSIDEEDYFNLGKTIFIANPNAPTGLFMPLDKIEKILKNNPQNIVVIDEAYVDFGAKSAIKLIKKYDNLIVCRTFSKSRQMAGARLGFAISNKEIIKDLNKIRYSLNPYNINRMTMEAALCILDNERLVKKNIKKIIEARKYTITELKKLDFEITDSKANFIFAKHKKLDGEEIYTQLKQRGILVRHFNKDKISAYNRITIGTKGEMCALIESLKVILED